MALTLDEIFDVSMKRRRKLLDMSKTKILSYADYAKYIERVPEMKMVPEEVDLEELNKNWGDFSFAPSTKERLSLMHSRLVSPLGDPIPLSMQGVRIEDLWAMDINWKMLTDLRPVNKYEADLFNRLIDMGKLRRSTKAQEAKALASALSNVVGSSVQAKAITLGLIISKNKKGTTETKAKTCRECGLEMCTGAWCKPEKAFYECYTRAILDKDELAAEEKGFSLKSVIAQANAKPDAKEAERKIRERREKKKGPSLKAMITRAKPARKKRKKKKQREEEN